MRDPIEHDDRALGCAQWVEVTGVPCAWPGCPHGIGGLYLIRIDSDWSEVIYTRVLRVLGGGTYGADWARIGSASGPHRA